MKSKKDILMAVIFTIFTCVFLFLITGKSNAFNKEIESLKEDIDSNEESIGNIKDTIDNLEDEKLDLITYLENLNAKKDAISNEIVSVNKEISTKENELLLLNEQIEVNNNEINKQYEDMKKRIQYMYENDDVDYLKLFLSASSISDFMNRTEYVNKILDYDRLMLVKYKENLENIVLLKENNQIEQNKLLTLKDSLHEKESSLEKLSADSLLKIRNSEKEIDAAIEKALEYEKIIEEKKNSIEALEEESRRLEAENNNQTQQNEIQYIISTQEYKEEEGDLLKLAAIIQAEAGGESYEGQLAVGTVVMNRVASNKYSSNITGVLYQPYQFSPVQSGRFELILAKGPNESCIKAAKETLYDKVRLGPWLYFRTPNGIVQGIVIGNHVFYGSLY